jgi:hypothetical protein
MAPFTNIMDFLDERAAILLDHYYNSGCFTGRLFDLTAGGGDRFTADDVVAVDWLGVPIPRQAHAQILVTRANEFNELLAKIPADIRLTDPAARRYVEAGSTADKLWRLLNHDDLKGVGWVTAHKLLAHKRPLLLPVYDTVVADALQPHQDAFWVPLWQTIQDRAVVERLEHLRADLGRPDISLLRILDVPIWMRHFYVVFGFNPCKCQGIYPTSSP